MEKWVWTTLLLCLYGFVKEIRPSEPYETEYLESSWKNLTLEQINDEIYPVWTYSYLAVLFVVLFVTDFLRYKPVIVVEGLAYIVTWSLMLWAKGVLAMQFMEFSYGIVSATEVAYFTYIYAKVPPEHYKRVTGYTRSSALFGQFLSGALSQILVSTNTLDYHQLNYVSFSFVSFACVVAACLPSVSTSIYFHKRKNGTEMEPTSPRDHQEHVPRTAVIEKCEDGNGQMCKQEYSDPEDQKFREDSTNMADDLELKMADKVESNMADDLESNMADDNEIRRTDRNSNVGVKIKMASVSHKEEIKDSENVNRDTSIDKVCSETSEGHQKVKVNGGKVPLRQVVGVVWHDLKSAYTDPFQLKWCLWWALATCSFEQVMNYCQPLWEVIYPSQNHDDLYNGSVYALNTLLGGLVTFAVGYISVDWNKWGEVTLAITSMIQAALLFAMAETTDIWIAYTFFILYCSSYCMLIAIASFQVAKHLKEESFGLVFGCNTFLALLIQTILTAVVVNWLETGSRTQFLIYGGYVTVIGIIFFVITLVTYLKRTNT